MNILPTLVALLLRSSKISFDQPCLTIANKILDVSSILLSMLVAGGKVIMRMTDEQDSRYVINESETTNIRVCGVGQQQPRCGQQDRVWRGGKVTIGVTDNCMASKIGSCCRMFESEVKSKQTNRGVPDGELVVEREVVLVLLIVTDSGSWIGESALCSVLLTRDLSFYVPMIRDPLSTWG